MSKNQDPIQKLIQESRKELDSKKMRVGHEERFLKKLKGLEEEPEEPKRRNWNWKPFSIAASVLIMISVAFKMLNAPVVNPDQNEQFEMPLEIANAEVYFQGIINSELEQLESSKNEHTSKLVEDTVAQLLKLENDYVVLQKQLIESYDRRVVKAMISNFQTRIDLLTQVMEQVEIIKNLKNEQNENNI